MKTDLSVLERLDADYIRAVKNGDAGGFEALLAEDFLNSNPDGSLVDRAGFLARRVRARPRGTRYTKADATVAAGRYTDVWARRDGRWICVAAHVTRG
jgi:hypothetical protein